MKKKKWQKVNHSYTILPHTVILRISEGEVLTAADWQIISTVIYRNGKASLGHKWEEDPCNSTRCSFFGRW